MLRRKFAAKTFSNDFLFDICKNKLYIEQTYVQYMCNIVIIAHFTNDVIEINYSSVSVHH